MKTAIYITNGYAQIVLTAENDWEKEVVKIFGGATLTSTLGQFYPCQGGYVRQGEGEDSLILMTEKPLSNT